MKLLNTELNDKIWSDVRDKTLKHASYDSLVRYQIQNNFGWLWSNDGLVRLKVHN